MARVVGPVISAVGHLGLLVGVLLILGQPKPFDGQREEAIAVEIVPPDEQPAKKDLSPEMAQTSAPELPQGEPEKKPEPESAEASQESREESPRQEAQSPPQEPSRRVAAEPPLPPQRSVAEFIRPPLPEPSTVDSAELLALYNMRTPGFDAPAEQTADLSESDVARLKGHLRKCWQLPEGQAAPGTRIVLRLFLGTNGALTGEPMLVEASASRDGPAVLRAALDSVSRCQPFSFLPAERYREWRQLDVVFSPREMGG